MGVKISELPEATSVQEEDIMPIVQNGETKKVSMSKVGGNEVFIGDTEEAPDTAKLAIDDDGVETYGLEVSISPTEPTSKTGVWLQHSGNLFDVNNNTLTPGYLNPDGSITTNPAISVTDYINIEGISEITISGNTGGSERIGFYTSDKTFIETVNTGTNLSMTISVPSNAVYVRATIFNSKLNEYKIYVQDKQYVLNNGEYEEFTPQNEIYSTTEQVVGTWEGKPLYRKIYKGTFDAQYKLLDTQPTYEIVRFDGTIKNTSTGAVNSIIGAHSTGNTPAHSFPYFDTSSGELRLYISDNTNSFTYSLIVEYTKTTDTATRSIPVQEETRNIEPPVEEPSEEETR